MGFQHKHRTREWRKGSEMTILMFITSSCWNPCTPSSMTWPSSRYTCNSRITQTHEDMTRRGTKGDILWDHFTSEKLLKYRIVTNIPRGTVRSLGKHGKEGSDEGTRTRLEQLLSVLPNECYNNSRWKPLVEKDKHHDDPQQSASITDSWKIQNRRQRQNEEPIPRTQKARLVEPRGWTEMIMEVSWCL